MTRENLKWQPHKRKSTNAENRGGITRSSNEASVMEGERRGLYYLAGLIEQLATGGNSWFFLLFQFFKQQGLLPKELSRRDHL